MEKILMKQDLRSFLEDLHQDFVLIGPTRKGAGPTRTGGITSHNYLSFAQVTDLDDLVLDYQTTMASPKRVFLPDREVLFNFKRTDGEVALEDSRPRPEPRAVIGVHPCDLAALKKLDLVFDENYRDPYYWEARDNTVVIGWTCREPASTCFCHAVVAGPDAEDGYDLLFTDLGERYFIKVGSRAGEKLAATEYFKDAGANEVRRRHEALASVQEELGQGVTTEGLRERMIASYGGEIWNQLSAKCAACGACNMVCPTCHCFAVVDKANVDETEGKRMRVWDSCHFESFAKMAGGVDFRKEKMSRFEHRLFDKFVFSQDRYGTTFCVGCGRCVKFCQNAIDLRQLLNHLRGRQ
ncbi:MAG: 4Fe-4S dicluster domain-containing protein [Thermodesulfobacteriota bacterium]